MLQCSIPVYIYMKPIHLWLVFLLHYSKSTSFLSGKTSNNFFLLNRFEFKVPKAKIMLWMIACMSVEFWGNLIYLNIKYRLIITDKRQVSLIFLEHPWKSLYLPQLIIPCHITSIKHWPLKMYLILLPRLQV